MVSYGKNGLGNQTTAKQSVDCRKKGQEGMKSLTNSD